MTSLIGDYVIEVSLTDTLLTSPISTFTIQVRDFSTTPVAQNISVLLENSGPPIFTQKLNNQIV